MCEQTRQALRDIEAAVRAGDYRTALADARRMYASAASETERAELLAYLGPQAVPPSQPAR